MLARVLALAAFAALLAGLLYYSQQVHEPLMVSGFIESDEIRLGSRVGGRVDKVLVDDGDSVKAGQVLVLLEPFDLRERLAQAQADVAARQAEYDKLAAGYRQEEIAQAAARVKQLEATLEKLVNGPREQEISAAQARLRRAQDQLVLDNLQLTRTRSLFERNTATREQYDEATTASKVSQEEVKVAEQELDLLLKGTRAEEIAEAKARLEESRQAHLLLANGYRPEEVAAAKSALDAAKANVEIIQDQLGELTIRAPVDGVIEALELHPGDLVPPNAPVLSLADSSHMWVRAYVPENHLNLDIKDQVPITVDSFPGRRFQGHISFVARQAEFTPGNVQTPEERSKQVFRIKVELDEGRDVLRAGMVADVWLNEIKRPAATEKQP